MTSNRGVPTLRALQSNWDSFAGHRCFSPTDENRPFDGFRYDGIDAHGLKIVRLLRAGVTCVTWHTSMTLADIQKQIALANERICPTVDDTVSNFLIID